MYDTTPAKVSQCNKNLMSISTSRAQINTNIITKFPKHLAEVQTEIFERQTKMALMFEMALELDNVFAIFRVGIVNLLKNCDFSESSFPQGIIISHHFDGNKLFISNVDSSGYT
ncbi:hypothetical protein RRF57_008685 [Xylaria bambusicola]|uniref:Uncharacterized protein n=1 Tax=Xylaria bambusicola TaxID=326684 RepID=A0AAN7UUA9_9PEZI